MFTVYAIYNEQSRKIYVGYSSNIENRLKQHNGGFKGSYTTRFKGSWIIIYSEFCKTVDEARKRERQLKSFRGREFIKKHIPGYPTIISSFKKHSGIPASWRG